MTDTVELHPGQSGMVELGPELSGSSVIVEGRLIPRLTARDRGGDEITIVLDGRFSIDIPRERSGQICWMVANAMAIGAGYPSLSADGADRPFAPRIVGISDDDWSE
ncbi:hypothetical protein [Roseovarius amoyensis]|uniref:hypothetical protein n=1 Tax=Roseovarius amoyensis TaxID=2211448 RepID=UPI0013A6B1C2|nr:hypothetical protein [Roseovarius amoyensis]